MEHLALMGVVVEAGGRLAAVVVVVVGSFEVFIEKEDGNVRCLSG